MNQESSSEIATSNQNSNNNDNCEDMNSQDSLVIENNTTNQSVLNENEIFMHIKFLSKTVIISLFHLHMKKFVMNHYQMKHHWKQLRTLPLMQAQLPILQVQLTFKTMQNQCLLLLIPLVGKDKNIPKGL